VDLPCWARRPGLLASRSRVDLSFGNIKPTPTWFLVLARFACYYLNQSILSTRVQKQSLKNDN
jgi:hypothetical protein